MILEYDSGAIRAQLARSRRTLVQDVAFTIAPGESLALIGETGSGKTMIALSIMDLLPRNVRQEGASLRFCGAPLPRGRRMRRLLGIRIVYIPQNGAEFLSPSKKVRFHLYDGLKKAGVPAAKRRTAALDRLRSAGFESPEEVLDKYPFQLSGGMAQRVTIALAACGAPELIIADEPTNGLDQAARERFMALLATLFPNSGRLIITHDMAVAALCDRTLVLCGGRRMEQGPSRQVLTAPRSPYTRALLAALVSSGMAETPLLREGESPCPFYRRCPSASEACEAGAPADHRRGETEWWCCAP